VKNRGRTKRKKNESNKSKKEAHAQKKTEIQRKYNKKRHDRHQHNTDGGGQAMGEEVTHVQMSRWSKHTCEGSEQQ